VSAADPVHRIADGYLAELARHEPDAALALGVGVPVPPLPDFGPGWLQRRNALQGEVLAELAATPGGDGVLRAALTERLRGERALFASGFTARLVAPLATPLHVVRAAFDAARVTADADGEAVLRRLEAAPPALRDYLATLRWAAREPHRFSGAAVAPVRQLDALAAQIDAWLAADSFAAVTLAPDVTPADGARAAAARAGIGIALAEVRDALRGDLRALAPLEDAVGEDEYRRAAAAMLGAEVDLDDTYAFGWSELGRLTAEARALAERLGGRGADPVGDVAARLDADARYRLDGADDVRAWLTQRVADATAGVADAFDLPASVADVECVVTSAASGVVFYTPGAPDGSAPGRVVWTVPAGSARVATWQEVTSVHHEGVPGHHLQFVVSAAQTHLHPWQRHLCHVHGYAEGWAHYAEQLSDELGLIRDDAERLGLVLGRIWRAVRIVADIGLHTGRPVPEGAVVPAGAWSVPRARAMLVEFARVDPTLAEFEVDRYLAWPGQALAFSVGARLWRDVRRARQEHDGGAFRLRDFHRDALALGPMGLGPLGDLLARE
jgi:uncharacterized protein (DUF885 family)